MVTFLLRARLRVRVLGWGGGAARIVSWLSVLLRERGGEDGVVSVGRVCEREDGVNLNLPSRPLVSDAFASNSVGSVGSFSGSSTSASFSSSFCSGLASALVMEGSVGVEVVGLSSLDFFLKTERILFTILVRFEPLVIPVSAPSLGVFWSVPEAGWAGKSSPEFRNSRSERRSSDC
jgi:hypothetical protein